MVLNVFEFKKKKLQVQILKARAVVVTTGTFLGGRVYRGSESYAAGRLGEQVGQRTAEMWVWVEREASCSLNIVILKKCGVVAERCHSHWRHPDFPPCEMGRFLSSGLKPQFKFKIKVTSFEIWSLKIGHLFFRIYCQILEFL